MRLTFYSSSKSSWKFLASRNLEKKHDRLKLKTSVFLIKKSRAQCLNMNNRANVPHSSTYA